jgi:hypothetical protein
VYTARNFATEEQVVFVGMMLIGVNLDTAGMDRIGSLCVVRIGPAAVSRT